MGTDGYFEMKNGTRFGLTELFEALEQSVHPCLRPFSPNM
jgi:hypothetical protein